MTMQSALPLRVRHALILMSASLCLSTLEWVVTREALPVELADLGPLLWVAEAVTLIVSVLLIYFIAQRHNWARIVALVFVGVGLSFFLLFPESLSWEDPWPLVSQFGVSALDVAAIYFLFTGSSATWFSSRGFNAAAPQP